MRMTTADSCIPGSSIHLSSFLYSDHSGGETRSVFVVDDDIDVNFIRLSLVRLAMMARTLCLHHGAFTKHLPPPPRFACQRSLVE